MILDNKNNLIIDIEGKTQCISRKQIENAFSAPKTFCAQYHRETEVEVNTGVIANGFVKPSHYNNEKGSLYEFCDRNQLNSYEFDLIKRIMRCRKKGNFKEDLDKSKFLIDLYIKEYDKREDF